MENTSIDFFQILWDVSTKFANNSNIHFKGYKNHDDRKASRARVHLQACTTQNTENLNPPLILTCRLGQMEAATETNSVHGKYTRQAYILKLFFLFYGEEMKW